MTHEFNFKTREEYFEYKADWKKRLAAAYENLNAARRANKQYLWQYRPKGINAIPRKTKIGPNPDWHGYSNSWNIVKSKMAILILHEERWASKIEAGKQRAARLETLAV